MKSLTKKFDEALKQFNDLTTVVNIGEIRSFDIGKLLLEKKISAIYKQVNELISLFSAQSGVSDVLNKIRSKCSDTISCVEKKIADFDNANFGKINFGPVFLSSDEHALLNSCNSDLNALIQDVVTDFCYEKNNATPYTAVVNSTNRRIFLVHGRNLVIRDELAVFLKKKKFTPIILEQETNMGQFLLQKFITVADTVSYAIILMTGDDFVATPEGDAERRARQNVILELGYFISRLGTERIIILKDKTVENPSDIDGLLYETIESNGKWKTRILKELYALGYDK